MSDRALLIANLVVTGLILSAVVVSIVLVAPTVAAIKETTDKVNASGVIDNASAGSRVVSQLGQAFGLGT